jgi:hypothetical protein
MSYQRPAFWRVPRNDDDRFGFQGSVYRGGDNRKKVHFNDRVQLGSPAQGELIRGDIITKIDDYDVRDLRHNDAQMLFRNADNKINLVVRRNNGVAYNNQAMSNGSSRAPSTVSAYSPANHSPVSQVSYPHRAPSPMLSGPNSYSAALSSPVNTLPHTEFPHLNASGGYVAPYRPPSRSSNCFSPMPSRDYQQDIDDEQSAIINQPYRTTPLILPGAKVKKDNVATESYLRHHPNPGMRAHMPQEYQDVMRQKVADTVLHRVVGDEARNGKVVHKQFNSPIGLYSDQNIESTIKSTVPINGSLNRHMPSKIEGYKKTLVYDPSKSETYRAIHEQNSNHHASIEIPVPVQTKVYSPNRLIPGKKPGPYHPPNPPHFHNVNQLGEANDTIHQSGSFKRLMYSVMGETSY